MLTFFARRFVYMIITLFHLNIHLPQCAIN